MPWVKIKICGITNIDDALAAVDMGTDMLGFNFYPESPRYIDTADALDIINKIPTFGDTVGLFVNPTAQQVKEITEIGFLNWIQLHGDETPQFCDSLRWLNTRIMKAIRVRCADDIKKAESYYTDALLLDAYHPELYGGTGRKFDWNLIDSTSHRIFIAGGITPDNVIEAAETGVYGIDICSGIEASPGKKDHKKMKQLFDNIRLIRGQ